MIIQTKRGKYIEEMRKMYVKLFEKKMGRKITQKELEKLDKLIFVESGQIATIFIKRINKDEVGIILYFHTNTSKDKVMPSVEMPNVEMPNGERVKIRKIGVES
jgi:hypothetical protein